MRNKTQKDEFDIIRQPKHLILSILLVRDVFPLPKEVHESLERLGKISDVLFVFDEDTFKETKKIEKSKFASLYESSSWVISNTGFHNTLINSLVYEKEVFSNHHTAFLIGNLDNLELTLEECEAIRTVNAAGVTGPILKINRLGTEDFYKTYLKSTSFIQSKNEDSTNRFASYTSPSKLSFFRPAATTDIVNFWKTDEGSKYVSSFKKDDCRFLLSSLIKHLDLQYIDENVENVKV